MSYSVHKNNVHTTRAIEGGSMLMALVPEDVLAGLFEFPHEITLKVSDLYAKFEPYIAELSVTRYKTIVDEYRFDTTRYKLKPTGNQRLSFIKKVMAGSFNLGYDYNQPNVKLDAKAFYGLVGNAAQDRPPTRVRAPK